MIRVLLVDDEYLVYSFLKQLICWEDYGYEIVGQASNGRQAMDRVEQLSPDLLLLDVSMPELDGIGLIQWLSREHPEVRVIMLSSYSNYEYVRETMKLGAADYLLKHELTQESLLKALGALDFDKRARERQAQAADPSSTLLLRDSQVRGFFEGRVSQVPEAIVRLRSPLPVSATLRLSVARMDDDRKMQQESYLIRQVLATCVELVAQGHDNRIIYLGGSRLLLLYGAAPGEAPALQERRAERNMSIVRDAVLKYHNTYMTWNRGNRCEEPARLPVLCRELFARGETADREDKGAVQRLTIEQERRLIIAVLGKDRAACLQLLEEIFRPLLTGGEPRLLAGDLLALIVKLYQENSVPLGDSDTHRIVEAEAEQLRRYYAQLLIALIDVIDDRESYSRPVTEALAYVEKNYSRDLSLADIGGHMSMNPSYLSTLFKKETGMGLNQYIARVRVYAAGKRMLMENIPPSQVYEQTGFNNYNNFFKLFKEITGYTPKHFREQATVNWIASFHPLPGKRRIKPST